MSIEILNREMSSDKNSCQAFFVEIDRIYIAVLYSN